MRSDSRSGVCLVLACAAGGILSARALSLATHSSSLAPTSDAVKVIVDRLPGGQKDVDDQIELLKNSSRWIKPSRWEFEQVFYRNKKREMAPSVERHARFQDWSNALGPVLQCPADLLQTYGGKSEGHHVCIDPKLGAKSSGEQDECVVLSFGSANRFGFEEDVSRARRDCKIHIFDCFLTDPPRVPEEIKNQTTFHDACIKAKNYDNLMCGDLPCLRKSKTYYTWDQIVDLLELKSPPTVLKMDIEGHEWDILQEIAVSERSYAKPLTLSMEMHFKVARAYFPWEMVSREYLTNWTQTMLTKGGYMLVDLEAVVVPHCAEAAMVKLA